MFIKSEKSMKLSVDDEIWKVTKKKGFVLNEKMKWKWYENIKSWRQKFHRKISGIKSSSCKFSQ